VADDRGRAELFASFGSTIGWLTTMPEISSILGEIWIIHAHQSQRTNSSKMEGEKVRFGFHVFRHALATALVKLKVDAKTVQRMLLHEDFETTMQLYIQSDMETMRDAQGKFQGHQLGDRIHLLTGKVQK
jgi:integrase